jgi:tetratricopeptide (TPR) repeat protein
VKVSRKNTIIVVFLALHLVVTPRLVVAQDSVKRLFKQSDAGEFVGNYAQIENIRHRFLQTESNNIHAYNKLGTPLAKQKKFDEAITISQKVIQLDSADDYNSQGDDLYKQKKLDAAIAAYRKAIQLDPDFAYAYNGLGNALRDQKKLDAAIAAYKKAIQIDPDFAYAHNGLGNTLYDQKKLDEAIAAYQEAIKLKPDFVYNYNSLGNVLYDQKKLDEAIVHFRKAIQLKPNFAYPYNGLGNALYDQKKLDEAINAYKKAIEIDPKLPYPHNGLGNVLYDQKKLDEAIVHFRKAIQLKPNFAYPYNGLGNVLRDQNKLDTAINAFQMAIKLKPDFANAYNGMGITLYHQNKFKEAINAYNKAIQLDPNYADAYYNLGIVTVGQKQLDVAVNSFQKAIKLIKPCSTKACRNLSLAHNGLGFAFQKQGKFQAAMEEFSKAEDIDSSFVYAGNNYLEAKRLWTIKDNALAKVNDDRQWLPKNDPSLPMKRSVVLVTVPAATINYERQGTEIGTGIIIQRKANRTLILTNSHVIFDDNQQNKNIQIQVDFFSEPPSNRVRMRRDVKVLKVSKDKKLDLAVLEVIGALPEDIKPLPISSNPITQKIPARIIGHFATNKKGLFWFVESREISSDNKQKIQISQPKLESGYSGSPVTDWQNQQLLGIVFARDKSKQSFAYPISVILQQLRTWRVL